MKRRDAETPREDWLTDKIIGAAIEIHRVLGPGLLESAYEECLCYELSQRGLQFIGDVEMLDQRGLATPGDHAELLDTRGARILRAPVRKSGRKPMGKSMASRAQSEPAARSQASAWH